MARKLRIFSQTVFLVLFCLFLILLNYESLVDKIRVGWFLQLNPLTLLLTSIASRSIVKPLLTSGILIVVLTLFFGRFFCGYVCPLGAFIDFSDRFVTSKSRKEHRRPPIGLRRLKYIILVLILTGAVFGVIFPFFMDPLSIINRISVLVLKPVFLNVTALFKEFVVLITGVFDKDAVITKQKLVLINVSLSAAILVLFIVMGGIWDKRFWCQYICPTGALFAILSKFPFFRRKVFADKCNNCKICASKICPTRAIDSNDCSITLTSECILCGLCSNRKKSCSKLGFEWPVFKKSSVVDIKRRHLIAGITAGAAAVPLIGTGANKKTDIIRPPGSILEKDFLTRCLACGECIEVCPTNVLGPCSVFDGFGRMGTPRLIAQKGFCKEDCTACSNVCPTGALTPVAKGDKPFVKIGTAEVDNSQCIAWRGVSRCLVCMYMCPYNAITVTESGNKSGPVVNPEMCTGCGKCEHYCPVTERPAIRVISYGERRIKPGKPVLSEIKREQIKKSRVQNDEL